jgi:hypothetical protein
MADKPVDASRRLLSEEERKKSTKEIQKLFGLSRASAWRAKKQGWFCPGYRTTGDKRTKTKKVLEVLPPVKKEFLPGEKVELSELELQLSQNALATRYSIGKERASTALKNGFFIVAGEVRYNGPEGWQTGSPRNYNPINRWFRVNLATEELNYQPEKLLKLYAFWGMSLHQARDAKKCGYFCPNANASFEEKVDLELWRTLGSEVIEDAKVGVARALRKYFGSGWKAKLKGFTEDDLVSEATEHLRKRSGYPEFVKKSWRISSAKFGVLAFLGKEARRRKKEATTVDEIEGRFSDD